MTDQPTPVEQLLNLADRAERHGGLTPTEAARLREGVAHHCARADTLEAVCESNKRAYVDAVKDSMAADERAKKAEAAIERVRDRHPEGVDGRCGTCGVRWPCPDICRLNTPPGCGNCGEWHTPIAALDEHQEQ